MPRILIVDDNEALRKQTGKFLASHSDAEVLEAENGSEAFAIINDRKPDLILMDIRLGRENGLDLMEQIKEEAPEIVVAIFSNYDFKEYREAAFKKGAAHFISKSTRPGNLIALVESMIEPGRAE
jgi:DNA-binding NarL/FixJ family response regulator